MITRHYFCCLSLQRPDPLFLYGVLTTRSWLADPHGVLVMALSEACKRWGCAETQVCCEAFNAL